MLLPLTGCGVWENLVFLHRNLQWQCTQAAALFEEASTLPWHLAYLKLSHFLLSLHCHLPNIAVVCGFWPMSWQSFHMLLCAVSLSLAMELLMPMRSISWGKFLPHIHVFFQLENNHSIECLSEASTDASEVRDPLYLVRSEIFLICL